MTNRDRFNKHVRDQIEKQISYYENLSNEELVDKSFETNISIKFDLIKELSYFKMDSNNEISVGDANDVKEWLNKEVPE